MAKFKFEELNVYQRSLDFLDSIYDISKELPHSEIYNLSSQMKRAATSIALNIAEGQGDTNAQFNRFLQIGQGSIKECLVCLTIAERQGFIGLQDVESLKEEALLLAKMISSLQNYLKRKNAN